jgi:hypothetical protein
MEDSLAIGLGSPHFSTARAVVLPKLGAMDECSRGTLPLYRVLHRPTYRQRFQKLVMW